MASLRKRPSGGYYLEFRYRGSRYHRSLQTDSPAEARQFKAVVERSLTLLKEGVLHLPDQVTANDLWQFLRSGGRCSQLPQVLISPPLGDICDEYLASFNHGTKEDSTLNRSTSTISSESSGAARLSRPLVGLSWTVTSRHDSKTKASAVETSVL